MFNKSLSLFKIALSFNKILCATEKEANTAVEKSMREIKKDDMKWDGARNVKSILQANPDSIYYKNSIRNGLNYRDEVNKAELPWLIMDTIIGNKELNWDSKLIVNEGEVKFNKHLKEFLEDATWESFKEQLNLPSRPIAYEDDPAWKSGTSKKNINDIQNIKDNAHDKDGKSFFITLIELRNNKIAEINNNMERVVASLGAL